MSSLPNIQLKLKRTFGQNARLIITRSGPALVALTLFTTFIEQLLTSVIHEQLMSQQGTGPLLWIAIFTSAIISILYPVIATLLTLSALQTLPIWDSARLNFEQLLIENLRAFGKAMTWGLCFILPGIVRFIQFSFVNFVVILDPDYSVGKIDALKKSVSISNQRFFKVFGIFLLTSILVPVMTSAFDEYSVLTQTPISAFLLVLLEVLLFILLNLLLLKVWESANGTHV